MLYIHSHNYNLTSIWVYSCCKCMNPAFTDTTQCLLIIYQTIFLIYIYGFTYNSVKSIATILNIAWKFHDMPSMLQTSFLKRTLDTFKKNLFATNQLCTGFWGTLPYSSFCRSSCCTNMCCFFYFNFFSFRILDFFRHFSKEKAHLLFND